MLQQAVHMAQRAVNGYTRLFRRAYKQIFGLTGRLNMQVVFMGLPTLTALVNK